MFRKALIAITAVITTNVATAAWIDLGNLDSPTLANSIDVSCMHRVVNKANGTLLTYIYPENFTQITLQDTFRFYASPSVSSIQQMLKYTTSPKSTAPNTKLISVLEVMHEKYPESQIKDLSLVFNLEQGIDTRGDSQNEIYIQYSLYDYHGVASNGTTLVKGFDYKVDSINKKYFFVEQFCY